MKHGNLSNLESSCALARNNGEGCPGWRVEASLWLDFSLPAPR